MEKILKEVKITRMFAAPVQLVWQAWVDSRLIQQWFGPKGFTNIISEVDAQEGEEIHIVMEDTEGLIQKGSRYPMKGVFIEVVPEERLVFTNNAVDAANTPLIEGITTVTFEEAGDMTKMTMDTKISNFKPGMEQALNGMEEGWIQSFEKLKILLEKLSRQQ